jgi:hypothetical protein
MNFADRFFVLIILLIFVLILAGLVISFVL